MLVTYEKFFLKYYLPLIILANKLKVNDKPIEHVLDIPFLKGEREILLAMTL